MSAIELLAKIPTASISDALDALGLPGSLEGIAPLETGNKICGPAFTVRYEPITAERGTVGDFLDDIAPGSVILIDNQGRTDCTVWGGIMTETAFAKGIAGTVINGTCRDVATSLSIGYPIWSASRFMRTGKDRVKLAAVQENLTIDGVTITPGDLICGDSDGVLVVPAERADEVAALAESIENTETSIIEAVRSGKTLREARAEFGYHSLQTRRA